MELYTRAVTATDFELAEQYYTEFSAYVHDELFINFGICLIWDQMVVGPEVGDWGWGKWMTIWDAYADIEHSS